MSRIPPAVIEAVEARALGYCELCGFLAIRAEFHHRRARKQGGGRGRNLDVASNLLRAHARCHAWAHAHPEQSREHGWIVSEWDPRDPRDVPVIPAPSLAAC